MAGGADGRGNPPRRPRRAGPEIVNPDSCVSIKLLMAEPDCVFFARAQEGKPPVTTDGRLRKAAQVAGIAVFPPVENEPAE